METFLRPPMFLYRRMHSIYICSRQFRTRPSSASSFGFGSPSPSQNERDLDKFYKSDRIQQVWEEAFDRIKSVHENKRAISQAPNYKDKDRISNRNAYGISASRDENRDNDHIHNREDRSPKSDTMAPPRKFEMFSLDDKQLMKLSFAEGYFYGQHHAKKTKFRFFRAVREGLGFAATLFVGWIAFQTFFGSDGALRRVMLNKNANEVLPEDIDVTFAHVKGCDEAKQELVDVVEFLKKPEKFSRLGGKLPKGVLLVGPPGTGKTLLARAVAGEAGVPFLQTSGSEFDEVLVGQGARRVRDLFERAKAKAPCVIFIDEIDSIGGKRSSTVLHPYANQTINQLLSEMDGFAQNEGVIVIGATNRDDELDKALLRPGRFDVRVTVPKPDYKGRLELIEYYLSNIKSALDIDVDVLSRNTVGMTGADIENIINQAALKAAVEDMDVVTQEHIEYAHDKLLMGPEKRSRIPDKEQNTMTAYHEGGHALVAYYTEKADNLHKVTIISRNHSLGHTATLPGKDIYSQTKEQLMAKIDILLGGRMAEEMIFGTDRVTAGCSSDLSKANHLANTMVKDLGMSNKVGLRVVRDDATGGNSVTINSFSDATNELVENEINNILEESKSRVKALLTAHSKELKLLAEALLKYETLDLNEVKLVLEGKDPRPTQPLNKEKDQRDHRLKISNLKVGNTPDRLPLDLLK